MRPAEGDEAGYAPPAARPEAPEIAGFTDLVEIGRGGDSTIYRAQQTALDRLVAIKVVHLSGETDPDDIRRFRREITLTVQLGRQHPNIMKVLDSRTLPDGRECIVMDFYELGSTYDRLRANGPFAVADVLIVGSVIADAVGFAHTHGVVHRDIKPQNILTLPTSYVLADFGVARMLDSGHTSSLERLSYRHASPEVLDGAAPEASDDLWSLGSTLFMLLDGRAPFAADDAADDTALAYLRRVRIGRRRPLPDQVPDGLAAVIEKALHPERAQRYQQAAEMLADLKQLEREVISWAPVEEPAPPATPPAEDILPELPHPGVVNNEDLAWAPAAPGPSAPPSASPPTPAASHPAASHPAASHPVAPEPALSIGSRSADPQSESQSAERPGDGAAPVALDRDGASGPRTTRTGPSLDGSLSLAPSVFATRDPAPTLIEPAEPTGLRPGSAAAAIEPVAPREVPPPKVRLRVVLLALGMLVVSALAAYLILKPEATPTAGPVSTPGGSTVTSPPVTPVVPPTRANSLNISDPEYAPTLLTLKFDGATLKVTFRPPNAEGGLIYPVDVTNFDPASGTGERPALTATEQDETSLSVPMGLEVTKACVVLVGMDPTGSGKQGISEQRCVTRA